MRHTSSRAKIVSGVHPKWPILVIAAVSAIIGIKLLFFSHAATLRVGDFETGDTSQYDYIQSCQNDGISGNDNYSKITAVTSATANDSTDTIPATDTIPVRAGNYMGKITVTDQGVTANCPNLGSPGHPSAEAKIGSFVNGDDRYIFMSTYFPSNFPNNICDPWPSSGCGWFQIAEIYGPPYGGSPSIGIGLNGNRIVLTRDQQHDYDWPWRSTTDIKKGTGWEDLTLHVKFSTDPSIGLVEIWHNGVKQTFDDGSQTLHYQTLVPGVNWDGSTPNQLFNNLYRDVSQNMGPGFPSSTTIFKDEIRIGDSYASVQPAGTTPPPPPPPPPPPTVSITSPANGATVSGTVPVNATTSGTGVTQVQFKDGSTLIGTDTTSPYSINWNTTGLSGSHSLTAIATHGAGTTASPAVNVTVNNSTAPPPPPPPPGTNVALGKIGISNGCASPEIDHPEYATNGSTTDGNVADLLCSGEFRVDLGQIYNLNDIKVWHYYADGRTYHNVAVKISNTSADCSTSATTVFSTTSLTEYAETSAGKDMPFSTTAARYLCLFSNGSSVNPGNHYIEVQAFTAPTSTCSTKQGDANGDNSVNILDIAAVLSTYGQTNTTNCADVDKSGAINIQDISYILGRYGT